MTSRSMLFPGVRDTRRSRARLIGMKNRRCQMGLLMLAADLLGFAAAISLVLIMNGFLHLFAYQTADFRYLAVLLICLLLFMNSRLYPGVGINPAEEIRLVTKHISISFLLGMILFSVIQSGWKLNILAFVSVGGFSLLTVLLARWEIRMIASRLGLWGEPVVVVGQEARTSELTCYFCKRRRLGFLPVIATPDAVCRGCEVCPLSVISLDHLRSSDTNHFADLGIQTVLVDSSSALGMLGSDSGRTLLRLFRYVNFVSDPNWLDGASIHIHDYEGLIGIEARKNTLNIVDIIFKRAMDILLSVVLGILSLPVLALTAILVRLDSTGSIIYTHPRIGKGGSTIKIYKFRTMVMDALPILEKHLSNHPEARREWKHSQKLRNDPRITRVGHYLRKFSIDELPQLLNVLKGDLSLVGPRPIVEEEVRHYVDQFDVYKSVQPGVTGIWQVSGRNHTSYEERVLFDMYYVRNWSVWLDLYILLRTVWVVLKRDGAY